MLNRRLQILIDEERYERLAGQAKQRKSSIGQLIREAIDSMFPARSPVRTKAAKSILSAPPMEVPGPDDLRAELEALRGRRG